MLLKKLSPIFIIPLLYSQEFDPEKGDLTETEKSGREMYTSVDVSFSDDKGNTDLTSLYYGFDFTLIGDAGPLTDTEFLISYYRTDDQLDNETFSDDQSLTLKFDIWANQRISPFLFAQQTFDKTVGLNSRLNYGLGAKFGSGTGGTSLPTVPLANEGMRENFAYAIFFCALDSLGKDRSPV